MSVIKEFRFRFNDLVIDYNEIKAALGYKNTGLPAPFDEYLEEAVREAGKLKDIRSAFRLVNEVSLKEGGKSVIAEGIEFRMGKTVSGELKGSELLAFFICTAGEALSEKSTSLLKGEDPVLGYVYDVLGSAIAESAGDKIQDLLLDEFKNTGRKITNRYSPGYCHWNVSDQHKLFSLFGDATCGVTLTPSALMHPVKSISGVIGIGKEVRYRDYQCTLCTSKNCIYRNIRSV